jgi:hypothetical protein
LIQRIDEQWQYTVESDEDQRLLELIESGKSWVLISALLNRRQLSIKDRASYEAEVGQNQAARIDRGGSKGSRAVSG